MKKMLLSAAVAAAMGTTGAAYAIDLADKTDVPQVYAAEITPGTGLTLDDDTIEGEVGFSITENASKYVRLDFTPGLELDFTAVTFDITAASGATVLTTLASSGDDFAIFEVQTDDVVTQDDTFTIKLPATVKRINAASYTVDYRLYETASSAIAGEGHLARTQGAWLTFAQGYAFSCDIPFPSDLIDVTERTQFVGGGNTSFLATLDLDAASTAPFAADGSLVNFGTYFAGATLEVEGSIAGLDLELDFNDADAAADGVTSFDLTAPLAAAWLAAVANGKADMLESTYKVTVKQAATGVLEVDPLKLVAENCGTLNYSGSSDRLDLALTPGGAFTQMLRVTNPTDDSGAVRVKVWNDNGDSVEFPLSAIEGVDGVLGAQSSTKLININDINAAAVAADAEFALAETGADSKNKLRVEVRGEFNDIDLQAVTVSRDNNAFFQTK